MTADLVSDEQLAEIEQRADRLESIMADSHGEDEPCSAACEATADVYNDVCRLVRALRDARAERDALLKAPPTTLALVQREFVESELYRSRSQALRERDEARAANHDHKLLADEWWRNYRDVAAERDELRRLLRGAEAELDELRANREALATAWRGLSDRVEDAEARLDRIRRSRAVLDAGPHDYDSFCADVDAALAAPTGQPDQTRVHRPSTTGGQCGCARCDSERRTRLPWPERMCAPFIVCPDCGDKRCPRAAWHGNACAAAPTGQEKDTDG